MGSLFQLRDYWHAAFPGEEFGSGCVAVGDLGTTDDVEKIAIGSFQGWLRIICPSACQGPMPPDDLLFERKFDAPILQLMCGPFMPGADGKPCNLLAILFPYRLLLARLERCGTFPEGQPLIPLASPNTDDETPTTIPAVGIAASNADGALSKGDGLSSFYNLSTHFEARFQSPAYNFTCGPFGRSKYHMLCVQSMDGQLSIFDHNKIVSRRDIPTDQFLLPGCLTYCQERDFFLTNNSSLFLHCYTFSSMTSVGLETSNAGASAFVGGAGQVTDVGCPAVAESRLLSPLWTFNLGDDAVDIRVCRLTRGLPKNECDIVVLCPYVLYVINPSGSLRLARRLDVECACLTVYPLPAINADNVLVGSFNESIYVYSDVALEWNAKVPSGSPMALSVGPFCGVQGMIVALNQQGFLSINYLGTDPAESPIQPLESKGNSYADMATELRQLQKAIKQCTAASEDSRILPAASEGAHLRQAVTGDEAERRPAEAEKLVVLHFGDANSTSLQEKNRIEVHLNLILPAGGPISSLSNVTVHVTVTEPISVDSPHHVVKELEEGQTVAIPCVFVVDGARDVVIPTSLEVLAVAVFCRPSGDSCMVSTTMTLPLGLVARPVPPVKITNFSFQLHTSITSTPSLLELFADLTMYGNVEHNVLSLQYVNGADATILVSKNAGRFKLQGSTMEALLLLSLEVEQRLLRIYAGERVLFSIPDELPLQSFFRVVDTHVAVRKGLEEARRSLNDAADFFRAVQKRLLVHFRDRTPTDCTAMSVLFEDSYASLHSIADVVAIHLLRQRQANAMLNGCSRLIFFFLRIKYASYFTSLPRVQRVLENALICPVVADGESRWEEVAEAIFLRVLNAKDRSKVAMAIAGPFSTSSLKKCITALVEVIQNGGSFVLDGDDNVPL